VSIAAMIRWPPNQLPLCYSVLALPQRAGPDLPMAPPTRSGPSRATGATRRVRSRPAHARKKPRECGAATGTRYGYSLLRRSAWRPPDQSLFHALHSLASAHACDGTLVWRKDSMVACSRPEPRGFLEFTAWAGTPPGCPLSAKAAGDADMLFWSLDDP
jgi:hypothetical protein